MKQKFIYFCPENTGWSNGVSWFLTFGTVYDTLEDAREANKKHKQKHNSENINYRIVKVTETREVIKND